jgi:hypothetical protein
MLFSCPTSRFKAADFCLSPANLITSPLEFSIVMFSLEKSAYLLNLLLYRIGSHEECQLLRAQLKEAYVRLDPLLPPEGKFLRKWRLQLNVSAEELLSVVRT